MSTDPTLIARQVAVVIIEILISSEGVRRATLMEDSPGTTTTWGLRIVDVVTCLTCVHTRVIMGVNPMGAASWGSIATA